MARGETACPLCGASLAPAQVLNSCDEIVDAHHGVLGCRCPYCQGYFEVKPTQDRVDIGYLQHGRFDVVLSLPYEGLTVDAAENGALIKLAVQGKSWEFE